jgi:hypothetical protein
MKWALLIVAFYLGAMSASHAQDFSVINAATNPGKARFMQLAQKKFDQDHAALFQTARPNPEDEQPVFDCSMKAVMADMPDADAGRLADIIEGKIQPDPSLLKWFDLSKQSNPARYKQVVERAKQICSKYSAMLW